MNSDSTAFLKIVSLDINAFPPTLDLELGPGFLLLGVLVVYLIYRFKKYHQSKFEIVEMEVEVSGSPSINFKVKRDYTSLYVATRIYIELTTRKVAQPFEEGKDVLLELYDSWYALFGLIRAEMKEIPSEQLRDKNFSLVLIQMTTQILNKGLRPHLTIYHADFNKWYREEIKKPESEGLSPQEIQQKFPEYKELVKHLQQANKVLNAYIEELRKLIDVESLEGL